MSNNVTGNYSALLGNRVPAQSAPAASNVALASLPAPVADSMSLTAAAPGTVQGSASVTATPAMRDQLIDLRKQLMDIDRELQQMTARLDAGQPAVAAQPASAVTRPTGAICPPSETVPAAAAPAAVASATGGSYKVQAGDYLWKVAKLKLGDANRWPEIYKLNKDVIGDNPNLLQPGQTLKLPGGASPSAHSIPQRSATPTQAAAPVKDPLATYVVSAVYDVGEVRTQRQIPDQQAMAIAREFGLLPTHGQLTPFVKENVAAFMDEVDSYEKAYRGQVFGPGMDNTDPRMGPTVTPAEAQTIHQSIGQIQQALGLLIKAGKLEATLPGGQRVQDVPVTGSYFQVDAQGNPRRDAQGNPLIDPALVAAITQFKQDHSIFQNYHLGDGTSAINEYVGPKTIEALKQALVELQTAHA